MKNKNNFLKRKNGFTVVEIVIVVTVIAILATIVTVSFNGVQARGRDAQRSTSARIIAETLERYYTENNEYPGCADVTNFTGGILKGLDKSVLIAPMSQDKTQPSIKCQDMTNTSTDVYAYLGDGSPTCLTGDYCTSWTLKYKEESTNQIKSISSRQISESTIAAPANVVVTATNNGINNAAGTVAPATCNLGVAQYAMSSRTNEDAWTSYTSWSSSRALVVNDTTEGARYSFRAQARCVYQSTQISGTTMSNEADYVRPITPPAAPVLTKSPTAASGTADTVTYSWVAVACPTGATVEYSRAYGRDDSLGYRAYATSTVRTYSVATNIQGYEYKAKARAQCVSPYTSSGWGAESNEPTYLRSITAPGQASNFRVEVVDYTSPVGNKSDRLIKFDPPTCGAGTTIQGRYKYAIWNPASGNSGYGGNMFTNIDSFSGPLNRFKTTTLIASSEIDFTPRPYVEGGTNINRVSYLGDYAAIANGMYVSYATTRYYRIVVQYRCFNPITERFAEGVYLDSGIKNF